MNFFDEEKIHLYLSYVIVFLLLVLSVCFLFFIIKGKTEVKDEVSSTPVEVMQEKEINNEKDEIAVSLIKVDIKGAVKTPGVYEATKGMVVQDIITLAGGLKSGASTKYINLAYQVTDQMVIRILTTSEIKTMESVIKENCICPSVDTSSCDNALIVIPEKPSDESGNTVSVGDKNANQDIKTEDKTSSLVSINTATLEELTSLPGIGEAKAKAIIAYRETNGLFKRIEDIKNVSGIGDSVYQKIKDFIKL